MFVKVTNPDDNKNKYSQHNSDLMEQRDCLICVNNYCSNITEYTKENSLALHNYDGKNVFCPDCNRPLRLTIKGSGLFELTNQEKEQTFEDCIKEDFGYLDDIDNKEV